eukprot:403340594
MPPKILQKREANDQPSQNVIIRIQQFLFIQGNAKEEEKKEDVNKRTQKAEQKQLDFFIKKQNGKDIVNDKNEEIKKEVQQNLYGDASQEEPLKIWHWNVNGIRAVLKSGKFQEFCEKAQPHILCLNETKIDVDALAKENIKLQIAKWFPIDTQYWNCCIVKKGYAGTAILINKNYKGSKPTKVEYGIGISKHDKEGRMVNAQFDKFNLVATYIPNAGVMGLDRLGYRVNEWDRDFHTYLKNTEVTTGKPVIWCGDLNVANEPIDIYNPKGKEKSAGYTIQERNSFKAFLKDRAFIDTYRHLNPHSVKYSYWNLRSGARDKDQGWRLDYFVVSDFMMPSVLTSEINNEYHGSDHCPLSLSFHPDKIVPNKGAAHLQLVDAKVDAAEGSPQKVNGKLTEQNPESKDIKSKTKELIKSSAAPIIQQKILPKLTPQKGLVD